MKNRKPISKWLCLPAGGAVYALLLVLLTLAERTAPNSSIQTFVDALWYSIVTISTVGYGDLYPVTAAGKVIGLVFVILSVGALAFLVGSAVSLMTGKMLPRLQLRLLRRRPWFVFSALNDASRNLACSLMAENSQAVALFPLEEKGEGQEGFYYYPDTISQAVKGKTDGCCLVILGEDGSENYAQALQLLPLGYPVYCCTDQIITAGAQGLYTFDPYACCAREYWIRQSLKEEEKTVLLIGSGRWAQEVLERGLMMNVLPTNRAVSYHMFGDWQYFRSNHTQLDLTLCLDAVSEDKDSLIFHEGSWNADEKLLRQADRIILCCDDIKENMSILRDLRRYFPVTGKIHIRSRQEIIGEQTFGTDRQIYTAPMVIADRLTETARRMHAIYLKSTGAEHPKWEELGPFLRQSNIAAADHLLVKVRLLLQDASVTDLTPEICAKAYQRFADTLEDRREMYQQVEHLRWMRFHSLYNWRYGPARDNSQRIHPLLIPYEDLDKGEQSKDLYAWQLLQSLAGDQ